MSGFTPGPWEVRISEDGDVSVACVMNPMAGNGFDYFISESVNGDRRNSAYTGRPIDNARLIAAAPDLYAALAWYVENDDTNHGLAGNEFYESGCHAAKSALAKALGKP